VSELTRRVLFSVVAAPVAIAIVLSGGAPLAALLAIVSALAAWEFFRLARASGLAPLADIGVALAGVVPLLVHARYLGLYEMPPSIVALIVLALMALTIWTRGVGGQPAGAAASTMMGVVYTGGMLSFGYAIRYHDYVMGEEGGTVRGLGVRFAGGGLLLLLPLLLTWATDIGAYAAGRSLGTRKLMPSISPGKTVAGAVGGLLASVFVAWLYLRYVLRPATSLDLRRGGWLLFGAVVSVAAQTGDLFESLLKREAGVKDSSHIIPGHGGVLDRLDSLLFVLPVAYVLLGWLLVWTPR
jgi:phosphatidate cytidylyltransferase